MANVTGPFACFHEVLLLRRRTDRPRWFYVARLAAAKIEEKSGGAPNRPSKFFPYIRYYLSRLVDPFVRRKRSNQSHSLRAESNPNWGMLLWTYLARSTYVLCFFAGRISRSRRYLQYSRLSGEVERFLGEDRAMPERSMTEASSPLRRSMRRVCARHYTVVTDGIFIICTFEFGDKYYNAPAHVSASLRDRTIMQLYVHGHKTHIHSCTRRARR